MNTNLAVRTAQHMGAGRSDISLGIYPCCQEAALSSCPIRGVCTFVYVATPKPH